jgi:hypothetical protein
MAKFSCNRWQVCRSIPAFEQTLLPLIIETQSRVPDDFTQFYRLFFECIFVTPQIESLLRESVGSRIPSVAKSTDLPEFGAFLAIVLQQSEVNVPVKNWIQLLESLASESPPSDTIEKALREPLSVIPSLFPMEKSSEIEIASSLVSIVLNSQAPSLRQSVANLMVSIVQKAPFLIIKFAEIVPRPESSVLVPTVMALRANDERQIFGLYAAAMGVQSSHRQNLIRKIGHCWPRVE